jgi:hypothetical protein
MFWFKKNMKKTTVKKIIKKSSLMGEIKPDEVNFFCRLADVLDESRFPKKDFESREFEISFLENSPKLRLLHLEFWQPDKSAERKKEILKLREDNILEIVQMIEKNFDCNYDLKSMEELFGFNRKESSWPIQFGIEFAAGLKPKIKIYLSINGAKFSLKKFCEEFNLKNSLWLKLKKYKFDTVAMDFSEKRKVAFKFYPFTGKTEGLLLRIGKQSEIISQKVWLRLPGGINMHKMKQLNFMDISRELEDFIVENKLKIRYLCYEADKKSLYFR